MSIIHREKERHGDGNYHFEAISIEGTSARTRAFSFEEVMSRRRNKKLDEDAKGKAPLSKVLSEKGESETALARTANDGRNKLRKDSKDTTGNSKEKEEAKAGKKNSYGHHKDKRHHDLEANMKAKSTLEKSSREKKPQKEKHSHHRSTTDDRSKDNTEKGSSKKPSKSFQTKDKHDDEDGKSMRDNKRKSVNGSDEKSRREMDGFVSKNHDSSKRQDLERRKIQRYEEPKSKRRRSRSHEYDRGRDRGSVSVSPRAHKRSFHGRDYGESSSHSFKDRSGRRYSDADKYRTSASGNNGYESSRYRRRGSGLGGYSPRKRRADAAVFRIPSPTTRSPERKGATWDLPPSEVNHSVSGPTSSNLQPSNQNVHDQPPPMSDSPNKGNQRTPSSSSVAPAISLASIDTVHLTQATRPMRRLYIENLPASSTDKSIIGCLNDFLLSAGSNCIPGTQPCISCIINKEKNQAVVEFLTPEDATAALSFDGKPFSGSILKLRRPKDFIDTTPTTGAPEKPAAVVNTVADIVKDSPHKIFIGGISELLSSDMLLEVVSVFGPVKAYHFEFNLDLHQSCAFLEYVDQSVTHKACAGLNGMKLGGSVLTVVKALPDTLLEEENADKPPLYGVPEHARPLFEDPTQVLKLKNVFDQENFLQLSESEVEEILEDIRLECARFGTVKSINIVRYTISDNDSTKVEQHLIDESGKMMPSEDTAGCGTNLVSEQAPLENVIKSPDIGEVLRNSEGTVDKIDSDLENGDPRPFSQATTDTIGEGPVEHEVAGGEVNKEEFVGQGASHGFDNGPLVTEESNKVEVTAELGRSSTELDYAVPEKSNAGVEDGNHQVDDHLFEPGCVLVEFLRKEATCTAAHSLNGRLFDGRVVTASYAAYDVYIARFPR